MDKLVSIDGDEERKNIENLIRGESNKVKSLMLLDAGCGKRLRYNIKGLKCYVVGVDSDKDAIEIRQRETNDLSEIIVSKLENVELGSERFDVVVNTKVLEYIQGADHVLDKFFACIKENGILVLTIPDRNSVHSFLSRITPHWFHVFYFRYVIKIPNAGLPGHDPYRVVYDKTVSRKGIHLYCSKNRHNIEHEYCMKDYHGRTPVTRAAIRMMIHVLSFLTLGYLIPDGQITFVIRKRNKQSE